MIQQASGKHQRDRDEFDDSRLVVASPERSPGWALPSPHSTTSAVNATSATAALTCQPLTKMAVLTMTTSGMTRPPPINMADCDEIVVTASSQTKHGRDRERERRSLPVKAVAGVDRQIAPDDGDDRRGGNDASQILGGPPNLIGHTFFSGDDLLTDRIDAVHRGAALSLDVVERFACRRDPRYRQAGEQDRDPGREVDDDDRHRRHDRSHSARNSGSARPYAIAAGAPNERKCNHRGVQRPTPAGDQQLQQRDQSGQRQRHRQSRDAVPVWHDASSIRRRSTAAPHRPTRPQLRGITRSVRHHAGSSGASDTHHQHRDRGDRHACQRCDRPLSAAVDAVAADNATLIANHPSSNRAR